MDDEDFDDLLAGAVLLEDSSQDSIISAATNLDVFDHDFSKCRPAMPSSVERESEDIHHHKIPEKPHQCSENETCAKAAAQNAPGGTNTESEVPLKPDEYRNTVMQRIEGIFESFADVLVTDGKALTVTLKVRSKSMKAETALDSMFAELNSAHTRQYSFPGKSAEEAWRFTVIVRILELIYEALHKDIVLSKRDIYYRDPALFNKQANVDRCIDDIACTFGVSRSMLNISAVAKGLIAGAVKFYRQDGAVTDASGDKEGILVPTVRDIQSVDLTLVKWILVIEKEATFRSIAASSFWDSVSTQGIIITGKGYPDIATRALLHFLCTASPQNGFASPPAYGLVDFDPDGLAILSVYKHGSLALSHENALLCVPQIQWLGLYSEHMMIAGDDTHASQGLLQLSARDRKKALKMLDRCVCSRAISDDTFHLQNSLQTMLMLGFKAELQLLDTAPSGMENLLRTKLSTD